MAQKHEGKAESLPFFSNGVWCREIKEDKNKVNREKVTGATFDETVYFRFQYGSNLVNKNIKDVKNTEFKVFVKEYSDKDSKLTPVEIKEVNDATYMEGIDSNKFDKERHKLFEAVVKLDKKTYQNDEKKKTGSDLVLLIYLETTKNDYKNQAADKSGKKNQPGPITCTLPGKTDDYLKVGPKVRMVKLRVQVLDCITGAPMSNEKVSSVTISTGSVLKSDKLSIFFSEWDEPVTKDKYSCKSVQQALNQFCKPKTTDMLIYDTMERLYDCGKPGNEFVDDVGKKLWQKTSYNKYLKDRGYVDDKKCPVPELGINDKEPPIIVKKVIVDEYNGMRKTDGNGYLYITIPVDKFLDKKTANISIEFSRTYAILEKTSGDSRNAPPCRKTENDTGTDKNPLFNIAWDSNSKAWGIVTVKNRFFSKTNEICCFDNSCPEDSLPANALKINLSQISINTEKAEITDYSDIDINKDFKDDFSVFFKFKDRKKNENTDKWSSKNYPANISTEKSHITMFLMTKWDANEQAEFWKKTIIKLKPENPIHYYKEEINSETKKKEKKKVKPESEFDDSKINIIAIRRKGFLHLLNVNRPNDIFIVIVNKQVEGIFYGSTESGEGGHSTLVKGQYTNYTIKIIWPKSNSPTLQQDYNHSPLEYTPAASDTNLNGIADADDPLGYTPHDNNPNIHFPGVAHILIHYGGRGFDENEKKEIWEWAYVNVMSYGCQVVCGSHYIGNTGELKSYNKRKLPYFTKQHLQELGAYGFFSDIWYTTYSDKKVTFTLIDESDLSDLWFYNLYRKKLFYKV